jgi:hypothetical protein
MTKDTMYNLAIGPIRSRVGLINETKILLHKELYRFIFLNSYAISLVTQILNL